MLLTDLNEVKSILDIDERNTQHDKKLNFYADWASSLIEKYLNRPDLLKAERTEYYAGSGTQKLVLRSRPAFFSPAPRAWADWEATAGQGTGDFPPSKELTYGTDFVLLDDDGRASTDRAILYRKNDSWPRPPVRQRGYLTPYLPDGGVGMVKVVYTAGYTPDTLPGGIVAATVMLTVRMYHLFPLAFFPAGESYEDRSVSVAMIDRDPLMSAVKRLLFPYRNHGRF